MFVSREVTKMHMPHVSGNLEVYMLKLTVLNFVEKPLHFARQGNMYSSYKNHSTYKCLIGVAPNGAITNCTFHSVIKGLFRTKKLLRRVAF